MYCLHWQTKSSTKQSCPDCYTSPFNLHLCLKCTLGTHLQGLTCCQTVHAHPTHICRYKKTHALRLYPCLQDYSESAHTTNMHTVPICMKSENMTNTSAANILVYSIAPLYWSNDGNSSYRVAVTLIAPLPSKYFTLCQRAVPVSDHSAPYSMTPERAQQGHS